MGYIDFESCIGSKVNSGLSMVYKAILGVFLSIFSEVYI